MSRKTQRPLPERVASAADSLLAAQGEVDPIHVFMVMGWTEGGTVKRWQQGQVGSLEEVIQTRPERIAEALALLRSFATEHGLIARETPYVAANPGRKALRFSRSGEDALERAWRTHWVSPALSEKQRERRAAKA